MELPGLEGACVPEGLSFPWDALNFVFPDTVEQKFKSSLSPSVSQSESLCFSFWWDSFILHPGVCCGVLGTPGSQLCWPWAEVVLHCLLRQSSWVVWPPSVFVDAFDNDLMHKTLKNIVEGKTVEVPTYDFVTHSR